MVNKELMNNNLLLFNSKENNDLCYNCWARYLCKECAAEMALRELENPVKNGKCKNQYMYEICLKEFLNFMQTYDLNAFLENFNSYSRYRNV